MNFKLFKHILPATAVVLSAGLSSCVGDLDVTPIDPSTTMEVDEASLYTKCYATMALAGNTGANGDCDIDGLDGGTTGFVRQLWNANELSTDEAICAWGDPGIPQFNYNQWDSSHPMLQGFYYRLTTSISYCNLYLEKCAGMDATREAEVRFLRALYYYYLMDCFGNVPFATQVSLEAPQQILRADLFAWIESELKAVVDKMLAPAARTSADQGYGRADQDAVNLLLARMYLNAQVYTGSARWADAKTYAEKVINGPHKLWTTGKNGWSAYQMLFMGDNGESGASQEAILALLQDGITTTSWGTSLFLMASCWKDDMDTGGDYGTKEFWAGNRARKQLLAKFFPGNDAPQVTIAEMAEKANDNRALFYGKGRTLEVTKPSEFTSGYSVGKFRNTYSTGASPHNTQFIDTDYFLMRAAEAYLIAAEADLREDNDLSDAGLGYINALRSRAGASSVSKEACTLDYILDERSRELYYEGFRRTDLIRYGYFTSGDLKNLWEWKGGVQNGQGFEEFRNLFAIPSEDINANPNLKQNPGY
ncbi:MAG: RagB/SusD family nutrient uptake outer membrane protein [Bacteroidaceae bacterium]|nr:RagB/SusD family nutrient uptake outer membrane protein [Bacteroidaceae bacterium]